MVSLIEAMQDIHSIDINGNDTEFDRDIAIIRYFGPCRG